MGQESGWIIYVDLLFINILWSLIYKYLLYKNEDIRVRLICYVQEVTEQYMFVLIFVLLTFLFYLQEWHKDRFQKYW